MKGRSGMAGETLGFGSLSQGIPVKPQSSVNWGLADMKRKAKNKSKPSQVNRQPRRVGQGYPPKQVRSQLVDKILQLPEAQRTRDQWFTLGHLTIYESCLSHDLAGLNRGCAALRRAAEWKPPDPEAALELVWVFQMLGLPAMAQEYAKVATDLLPHVRDSWRFRAGVHASVGERAEAIECMERAVQCKDCIESDGDLLADLNQGKPLTMADEMVSFGVRGLGSLGSPLELDEEQLALLCFHLEQILKGSPESDEYLYALARCRYSLKQYPETGKKLAILLERNSQHVDGWVLKGLTLQKQDRAKEAEGAYRQALQLDPEHYLANTNLAYLLVEESNNLEGRRHLEVALRSNPDYAPTLSLYGNTLAFIEQNYAKELDYQKRALALEPNNPVFILNVCTSAAQSGEIAEAQSLWKSLRSKVQGATHETQKKLLETLLFPPDDAHGCFRCLQLLMETDFRGPALSLLLRKLWSLRFNFEEEIYQEAMHNIGLYAGQCNQHELSLRFFEEAQRVSKAPGSTVFNLAVALGQLERFEEALSRIQNVGDFSTPRAYTISGNLKRDAGRLEEALEDYRRALEYDPEFPLLYSVGTHLAQKLGRPDVIGEFVQKLEANQSALGSDVAQVRANCLLWLGFPRRAARSYLACQGVSTAVEDDDGEPSESFSEMDWSLIDHSSSEQLSLSVAVALLRSGQFSDAQQYAAMTRATVAQSGDWTTVSAEALRHSGDYAAAQQLLVESHEGPHRLTLALSLLASDSVQEARPLLRALADGSGDHWWHPEGQLSVVAGVSLARIDWEEGRFELATDFNKLAELAKADPDCVLAYRLIQNILRERGDETESARWLEVGLRFRVGDPELLHWKISKLIDTEDFEGAKDLLDSSWVHFQEYGRSDLGHLLREELLTAELLQLKGARSDQAQHGGSDNMPWLDLLQLNCQKWLRTVLQNISMIKDLRTGICLYLCKTAELELFERLIYAFRQSLNGRYPARDEALKDLSQFIQTGRGTIGLGACSRSLYMATRPATAGDSSMVRAFRTYIQGLNWRGADILFSEDYLRQLRDLAGTRNRLAHKDDIGEAEFTEVFDFLIDGNKPGLFFRAFGLHGLAC